MSKYLIIGGQGFVGSHVVDNLLDKGHEVLIMDRALKHEMWKEYEWDKKKVTLLLGDIKNRDTVMEAVSHCDAWINLAGLLGTQEMLENSIPAVEVNIIGALNIFDAARIHKKKGLQIAVGNYWMNNPYSITKNTTERFALMYNKEHGTDIRVCRGMNVFGERQAHAPIRKIFPNLVIPALLHQQITIYGDGKQVMDLIYVKDIAEILVRILLKEDIPNDIIYEAGVGGGMTINNAVGTVLQATKSRSRVKNVPMRPGETKNAIVEISEQGWKDLENIIGFKKSEITPMDKAIADSIVWYRENLDRFKWNG